ncbi:SPOSA6832_00837, partial [Sporobolomyces salmonicolor]
MAFFRGGGIFFALVALSLVLVVQAKPVNVGASVLVRRSSQPLLYSNEAIFDKDSAANSRKEAAAHIRRAKLRAAKKAKRAHAEVLSQELVKRAVSSIEDPEGLTKRGIERRALFARALKRVRCGQSARLHINVSRPSRQLVASTVTSTPGDNALQAPQLCDSSNGYTAGPSDNGIGTPSCSSGACRIVCPAGYSLRKAQSTTNPYYCYNGSSSLVSS